MASCALADSRLKLSRRISSWAVRVVWADDSTALQASIANLTQVGIGVVRTRPCFPTRSTMHQRPSRCWICANVRPATSERRRPHPSRTASMARSRRPFIVVISGALRRSWACRNESQLPTRTPIVLTPWDIDLKAGTASWNETYTTLYGRPPDTSDSWQWWIDNIHAEDRERTVGDLRIAGPRSSVR